MKENTRFFLKVVIAHVFTYMFCGIIAMNLFSYWNWIHEQDNWRGVDSIIIQLTPVFQIIRGILYGIVLLLLKDTIINSKYGILKLFVIMIIIGIFNTPAPSPGSIEAFIYLKSDINSNSESLRFIIGGMLEIIVQNLLFCIIVCTKWKDIKSRIHKKTKNIE
jgi:hypothetical protein